jgi:Lrp/AsnC family leucine-responsive transcriptional regulator
MLDKIDRKILEILQNNTKTSYAAIGELVGMAPSAIFDRVKKLEDKAVIISYEARINSDALNLSLTAFLFIEISDFNKIEETVEKIQALECIQEVHMISENNSIMVKARVKDINAFQELVTRKIAVIDNIRSVKSNLVLKTFKETSKIPLNT